MTMKTNILAFFVFTMFWMIGGVVYGQNQKGNNLVRFEEDGKIGYINESGNIVIEPQFFAAGKFSEGLAPVKILNEDSFETRWGYIDENGKMVIEPLYGWADEFKYGLARVQSVDCDEDENYRYGIINKLGTLIVDTVYSYLWIDYGFNFQHEDSSAYDKDIYKVVLDNKKGFVTLNGLVSQQLYDNAEDFYIGKAAVEINGKWGFIDKTGKIIIEPKFDNILGFMDDGRVYVVVAGEERLIDKNGNIIE